MVARSGDVSLQLKQLKASSTREFVLESRSQTQHRIRQGWITVATRVPCSAGEPVNQVAVDGVASPQAVVPPGVHEVRVRVAAHADDFELDLVLDLRLADGACLRTPLLSQSLPLEVPNRPLLSLGLDMVGNSDLSGLRAVLGVQAGGAVWVGRFLLGAEAGAGSAVCNEGTCGLGTDKSLKMSLTIPVQAHASYRLGNFERGLVFHTFLLGLRYSYFPISLPALDGGRRFSVHGGYVTFTWASADPLRGALIHQERRPLYELVFPVGVLWEPGANKAVLTGGLAFRLLLPL